MGKNLLLLAAVPFCSLLLSLLKLTSALLVLPYHLYIDVTFLAYLSLLLKSSASLPSFPQIPCSPIHSSLAWPLTNTNIQNHFCPLPQSSQLGTCIALEFNTPFASITHTYEQMARILLSAPGAQFPTFHPRPNFFLFHKGTSSTCPKLLLAITKISKLSMPQAPSLTTLFLHIFHS